MTTDRQLENRLKAFRQQRGWSQDDVARRAGISRPAVSAIEGNRLVPSVAAALALAGVFNCRVEDLFGSSKIDMPEAGWAWPPEQVPCRFWQARSGGCLRYYPVELTHAGVLPHDGVFEAGSWKRTRHVDPETTLVLASCDPAAGLLATDYERSSGFRLLVLSRSSRRALELLGQGLVDVAGVHLASARAEAGNARAVKAALGVGYVLLQAAQWQEGLAVSQDARPATLQALLKSPLRWVGREPGSGARECQDEILEHRSAPRRLARDHRGVAEAIRNGWADVGVCLKLASVEAGLNFISLRKESYEMCFASALENDPRIRALIQTVRSAGYRQCVGELPGYDSSHSGELCAVK